MVANETNFAKQANLAGSRPIFNKMAKISRYYHRLFVLSGPAIPYSGYELGCNFWIPCIYIYLLLTGLAVEGVVCLTVYMTTTKTPSLEALG